MNWRQLNSTVGCLLFSICTQATHFLGGEIRYAPEIGNTNSYRIEVDLYSNLGSPSDRPEIGITFGDGTSDTIPRISIQDFQVGGLCGAVRLNTYQAVHTFPGQGIYRISFEDSNRSGGIVNIPNSIAQGITVEALLVIDPSMGLNTSIAFDTLQFQTRRNWNTLTHEPAPLDLDGDSLSFELIAPLGSFGEPIQGYQYPVGVNYAWLDPTTGTLAWDYPDAWGEWTLAIRGSEWRNGQLIGQVTRDMSICVYGFVTEISDSPFEQDFSIFPTISDDVVTIQNRTNTSIQMDLVATNGAVVKSLRVGGGGTQMSISQLASGMYTAQFGDENGAVLRSIRIARP